jgi:hypothetical protein
MSKPDQEQSAQSIQNKNIICLNFFWRHQQVPVGTVGTAYIARCY